MLKWLEILVGMRAPKWESDRPFIPNCLLVRRHLEVLLVSSRVVGWPRAVGWSLEGPAPRAVLIPSTQTAEQLRTSGEKPLCCGQGRLQSAAVHNMLGQSMHTYIPGLLLPSVWSCASQQHMHVGKCPTNNAGLLPLLKVPSKLPLPGLRLSPGLSSSSSWRRTTSQQELFINKSKNQLRTQGPNVTVGPIEEKNKSWDILINRNTYTARAEKETATHTRESF